MASEAKFGGIEHFTLLVIMQFLASLFFVSYSHQKLPYDNTMARTTPSKTTGTRIVRRSGSSNRLLQVKSDSSTDTETETTFSQGSNSLIMEVPASSTTTAEADASVASTRSKKSGKSKSTKEIRRRRGSAGAASNLKMTMDSPGKASRRGSLKETFQSLTSPRSRNTFSVSEKRAETAIPSAPSLELSTSEHSKKSSKKKSKQRSIKRRSSGRLLRAESNDEEDDNNNTESLEAPSSPGRRTIGRDSTGRLQMLSRNDSNKMLTRGDSNRLLTRNNSGRLLTRNNSGRLLSRDVAPVTPATVAKQTEELADLRKGLQRTRSGRNPLRSSESQTSLNSQKSSNSLAKGTGKENDDSSEPGDRRKGLERTKSGKDSLRDLMAVQTSARNLMKNDSDKLTNGEAESEVAGTATTQDSVPSVPSRKAPLGGTPTPLTRRRSQRRLDDSSDGPKRGVGRYDSAKFLVEQSENAIDDYDDIVNDFDSVDSGLNEYSSRDNSKGDVFDFVPAGAVQRPETGVDPQESPRRPQRSLSALLHDYDQMVVGGEVSDDE